MIFRFLILSDEVENFKREIHIDGDATFLDLHRGIIDCTAFDPKEMASFFICDNNWRRQKEIALVEMDTDSDEDAYIMEECALSDYLEDEKQKMMFMFDFLTERVLFIELSEIIIGKHLKKARCTLSKGEAPVQFLVQEELRSETASGASDELFYGDSEFSLDELDKSGYDGIEDLPTGTEESDLY